MRLFKVVVVVAYLMVATTFLNGCNGGSSTSASGQGALSAKLMIKGASSLPPEATTVRIAVSGAGMSTIQQDFPAANGSGIVNGVPIGIPVTVTASALDSSGKQLFVGSVANVTVQAGQTTDVGTITMNPVLGVGSWDNNVALMPSALADHAAVTLNDKIYVIGGQGAPTNQSVTSLYDPATNIWSSAANLQTPRTHFSAAVVNGKIYAIGGFNSTGTTINSVEEFDPVSNSWSYKTAIPLALSDHVAVAVDNKIYVVGGGTTTGPSTSTYLYDPATDSWSVISVIPSTRSHFAAVAVNGKIYAIGGKDSLGNVSNSVYVFDISTNSWTTAADIPISISDHGAAVVNNKIYVVGGDSTTNVTSSYVYDPATNNWSTFEIIPTMRTHFAAVVLFNKIYAVGGRDNVGGFLSSVDRYTP